MSANVNAASSISPGVWVTSFNPNGGAIFEFPLSNFASSVPVVSAGIGGPSVIPGSRAENAAKKRGVPVSENTSLASGGGKNELFGLRARLRLGVVFFVVNILRRSVLFPVDLLLFAGRQFSAVRGAVRLNLLVDALLLIFQFRRLACRQLPALDALRDAVLL